MYLYALGMAGFLISTATASAGSFSFKPYQTYDVNSFAVAVAVGDVSGDGRDDVVMTTDYSGGGPNDFSMFVFVQRPDGQLGAPTKYAVSGPGMALVDLNLDGVLDIVVGHETGVTTMINNPLRRPRTFGIRTFNADSDTATIGALDVDRDGIQDFVALNTGGQLARIYYGDGTGAVRETSTLNQYAVSNEADLKVGDLNNDGYSDLAMTSGKSTFNDSRFNVFIHDQVSGFMAPRVFDTGYDSSVGGVAIGDFNGDGRNDLASSKSSNAPTYVSIFQQQADGQFEAPTHMTSSDQPGPMVGSDIDGNGKDDLLVIHERGNVLGYYLQETSGLQAEILTPLPDAFRHGPQGLAVGDINHDGCKDVVIANYNHGLVWLHGNGCQVRSDLGVTVGLTSTTAAIRLEHVSGATPLQQPFVQIDLSIGSGTLQTGMLPAGCAIQSQTASTRRIDCLIDTLAPTAVTTLVVPLSVTATRRDRLAVSARASTDTPERSLINNQASKQITISPVSKQQTLKLPAAVKPTHR